MLVYPVGCTPANAVAASLLHRSGIPIIDHPSPDITHILTDIPGNWDTVSPLLTQLPEKITILGGRIPDCLTHYRHFDLLSDEFYLWQNAAITAECALKLAPDGLRDARVLVIGYGRIGKHLCRLLQSTGARVYLQSQSHRAEAASFGFLSPSSPVDLVYNTAPDILLPEEFQQDAVKIDLSSQSGMLGDNVIHARGLPGKYAPIRSGRLIAQTILKQFQEEMS